MPASRKNDYRNPSDLKRHPNHTRIHPAKKIALLARCIHEIGITVPVVVDENGFVLAGWAIVLAALQNGAEKVPVVVLSGLSETRKRAYLLFDNKISEHSTYDWPALADELKNLNELLSVEGLDLDLTGFNAAEIDALANFLDQSDEPDETLPPHGQEAVTRQGDIWIFNKKHRLLCGDARTADYKQLMLSSVAAMCLDDVPFNLSVPGIVGRGRIKHRNFAMASGEMSRDEFTSFLTETLGRASEYIADGSLCYIFMDWRHQREILDAGWNVFKSDPIALVVWAKTNPGQGSFYRSQHELIYVFKKGPNPYLNNVELGRYGRNRSNVWTYPGTNSFGKGRMSDLAAHPTTKPIALVADAIKDCTQRNDIVLDSFMGSGTTILAAERVGRRAYGIEIDPLYVDTTVRRWIATCKSDVILEGTGLTFDEVAANRSGGA
ncbi:MAG: DNA methyltransferase [Nitrobacter sp.]